MGTGSHPSSLQDRCDRSGRAHGAKRVTSGGTVVTGPAGSAEQLGKLCALRSLVFLFVFLLCSVEMQSSIQNSNLGPQPTH